MIVKLLTEHHLEFLSLTGDCRGSSESTHVKMSNCWKSRAAAHFYLLVKNLRIVLTMCIRISIIFGEKWYKRMFMISHILGHLLP